MDLLPEQVFDLILWLSGAVDLGDLFWLVVYHLLLSSLELRDPMVYPPNGGPRLLTYLI